MISARPARVTFSAGLIALVFALVLWAPLLQPSVKVGLVLAALLSLSVYLPLMAGQLSLASPGFYALGGYVAALTSTKWVKLDNDTGYWKLKTFIHTFTFSRELYDLRLVLFELVMAALAAVVLGVVVGFFALRLQGIYLALATIAFVEVFRILTLHDEWGGATGIFNVSQPFDRQLQYLWIAVPLLGVAAWFVYRLERTRIGRAFVALREDELAASANGIHPTYHKVLAFTLGAVMASSAGVISAHFLNTWNARQGTFDAATVMLAGAVIGGYRSFLGPIVGGALLSVLPEALRWVADNTGLPLAVAEAVKNGRPFVQGMLMVLVCIFLPRGMAPPRLTAWLFPQRHDRPSPSPEVLL